MRPATSLRPQRLIGEAGGNILEVEHQRAFSPLAIKSTGVSFIIETRNASHATEVITSLRAAGFQVRIMEGASGRGFDRSRQPPPSSTPIEGPAAMPRTRAGGVPPA